jgi:hypothetical protein
LESRAQIEGYLRALDDAIAAQPLLMTTTIRCWVPGGGAILAHGMTHRKGHHLQVDIPSKRCLLVLKLMAGRPKDSDDIDVLLDELDLSTRAQAQDLVNFFVPDRRWHAHEMLPKTLDALFG